MNIASITSDKARNLTVALGFATAILVGLSATVTAQAQQVFDSPQSIYIDGSTPVDARTKARVDAYFDEIENREQAKLEERERFNRFIYHDNLFGVQQSGRW